MNLTKPELSRDELYRRLEEAEEIIRAIREGEIDALVIRSGAVSAEEVFTLDGGAESYRSFLEAMDVGAAAFDTNGNFLYGNAALCALVDTPFDQLASHGFLGVFDNQNQDVIRTAIAEAQQHKTKAEVQVTVGSQLKRLMFHADALKLGVTDAVALTFTDITDRILSEQRHEAERTALAILASAAEAVVVSGPDGVVTHANAAAVTLAACNPVGMRFGDAFELDFKAATGLMQGDDFLSLALSGQSVQGVEAVAPKGRVTQDVLVSAAPLRVAENQTQGAVVTLVDLSRRKIAEKQQLLLMRELDHRVKNTLALVVSISNRTASTEDTVQGFRQAFSGRIHALAATHNVLAERSWSSILLSELVTAELAPFIPDLHRRFTISGGDVEILPRAAVPLGLIVHELATNAAKYGALSSEGGTVSVVLETQTDGNSRVITWTEHGGPAVKEPSKRGFGRTVIEKSLSYSPDGGANLEFNESGIICRIRIPVEDVTSMEVED
jgi:two-component sensor histidine kinase